MWKTNLLAQEFGQIENIGRLATECQWDEGNERNSDMLAILFILCLLHKTMKFCSSKKNRDWEREK